MLLFIILWVIGFYLVSGILIGGLVIWILIGFTDFDIKAEYIVGISESISLLGIIIGLVLGFKGKLPGTNRLEPGEEQLNESTRSE